jgi:hypothetical protein
MKQTICVWLLGLLAAAVWWLAAPTVPAPLGLDAPAAQFSAARAHDAMIRLLGAEQPHPVGSVAEAAVQDRLRAELSKLGVASQTLSGMSCANGRGAIICATVHDIVAQVRPGAGDAILLMAHTDSVAAGPGASDDMSGVAAILETIRALKSTPSGHPVIALFTDGEEAGLLGARFFLTQPDWKNRIGLVINADQRGTSGPAYLFQTSAGAAGLIDLYAKGVAHPATSSLYQEIYKVLPNDTDLTPFLKTGVAAANFAFIGDVARYHTPLDQLGNLDPGSLQSLGDNLLGLTRAAMTADFAQLKNHDAVYLDLLGHALPRLPQAYATPLAVIVFLLLALTGWLEDRRKRPWQALATPPLMLLGCVAMGFVLSALARVYHQADIGFAHPLAFRIALAFGCWAMALIASRFEAASWLWLAGLGLVTALLVPGLSPYFLFPAAFAALLFLLTLWVGRGLALFIAALAAMLIWLQLAAGLEPVMGLAAHYLFTVPVAFALMALLPVMRRQEMSPKARRLSIQLSLLVAFGAALVAGFQQPYSSQSPVRLNMRYIELEGKGYWMADPETLLRKRGDPPSTPSSDVWRGGIREAGKSRYPSPWAKVSRTGQFMTLDLHGSRYASGMRLDLPPEGLRRASVNGVLVRAASGQKYLICATSDCARAHVVLEFFGSPPDQVGITEIRYGVPPDGPHRPDWAVPSGQGDMTLISASTVLYSMP